MSEPRIRPLSDDQADGTQALLIGESPESTTGCVISSLRR